MSAAVVVTTANAMAQAAEPDAADAADRLILDEAAGTLAGATVLVVDSLPLAVGARDAGASRVVVSFDSIADEALAATIGFESAAMSSQIDVVLVRLPKSLRELDAIARRIAASARADVVVFAGARLKYMTPRMNEILLARFEWLDVSLARQKSRVLVARGPRSAATPGTEKHTEPEPALTRLDELDLVVASVGGVFASGILDLGTRALLAEFDGLPSFERAIDFGCGTGVLAAELKRRNPSAVVIASDASADAVASARATMVANGLDVAVVRESSLSAQPDASADLIVLNPPFHDGGAVQASLAAPMFEAAARVLRPGGQLWTVFNSVLGYQPELERTVGPTRQRARNTKFTVTISTKEK